MVEDNISLVSLHDIGHNADIAEDHDTMEENSMQKARFIFDNYEVNCFADDSGLVVDAINGAPGVYSARYAGPQRSHSDNNKKLLSELEGKQDRSARFKTVISLITNDEVKQFEGTVEGVIANKLAGSGGFGYDPLFIPEGYDRTFAQMADHEKNKLSSRGRAIAQLVDHLKTNY